MSEPLFEFISPAVGSSNEPEIPVKEEPPQLKCETTDELSDQNKCGEIFAAFSGNLILICGFCQDKFENMLEFGTHLQGIHKDYMKAINDFLKTKLDASNSVTTYGVEVVTEQKQQGTSITFENTVEPISYVDSDGDDDVGEDHFMYEVVEPEISVELESFSCGACGQRCDSQEVLRRHYEETGCKSISHESTENQSTIQRKTSLRQKRKRKRRNEQENDKETELSEDNQDCLPLTEVRAMIKVEKQNALLTHDRKMYPCELCERVFKSQQSLSCHVARGHKDAPKAPDLHPDDPSYLRCKFCNQEIPTRQECIDHEKTHTGDKPYQCWHCNLSFKTSSGRKRHIRIHTGERPFQCDECPKGFDNKEQLESHMHKHKNPRKFTCQTCGESFFRRFQLGLHEQRRHTGFRPLVCEDCGKSFVTMGELTQHRIRHSDVKDWKCEVCGKCFYSKWALKDHMAGHSDAKPFGCEVCGRWFSRPKALKKHKKLHSDVKAYVCNICGKAYAQDSGLYAHKKTHGIRSSQ